ncbi:sigma-70 family RNA polymerase sigma factor [bacterium]|nr:sigma-70 family RNA polymerase sigma factor [bacterium]
MENRPDLTRLLVAARDGRPDDRDELYAAVYGELRRIARGQRRRHAADATLHTTALVHESYLRLIDQTAVLAGDRLRFFATAARAMRHILVDRYRARRAAKRGGDRQQADLDPDELQADVQGALLLDLDEGLHRLAATDERLARVVELRFFVGLKDAEIGELIGVSDRTVRTDWTRAKAWLADFLAEPAAGASAAGDDGDD